MLERFAGAGALVIDDNAANVALLRAVLSRAGLNNVQTVTDSNLALARYDEMQPALVVLDLHMPGIDGFTLLPELRRRAEGMFVPLLVLTADTTRDALHRAFMLGARDFLTKPIDPVELTLRVHNMLETWELHDQLRHQNLALRSELAGYEHNANIEAQAQEERRSQIQQVLAQSLLRMVYQPVVELATRHNVGYEALARFPDDGSRTPDRWFADAGDAGLGVQLELAAVAQAVSSLDQIRVDRFLTLNVSPATALSAGFADALAGLAGPRVVIELTEHVPVQDFRAIDAALEPFRAQGIRLAVDDMGAGYAGFRHLLGLNPDIIKLDMSLTRGIDADPARRALAAALVSFSRDTAAEIIAEGIETTGELSAVLDLDVRWGQGYLLGRPAPLPKPA